MPVVDLRPGLAVVVRLVEVGTEVVELVHRRGDVAGALVARRGVERVDPDPLRDPLRRHVGPVLAAVARQLHVAVVGPGPDHVLLGRRLHDREDRVVDLDAGVVVGDRAARLALLGLVVARQIRADLLPRLTLVAASEKHLRRVVERVRVVRTKRGSARSTGSGTSGPCRRARSRAAARRRRFSAGRSCGRTA